MIITCIEDCRKEIAELKEELTKLRKEFEAYKKAQAEKEHEEIGRRLGFNTKASPYDCSIKRR